ncbi:MAG TPA: alpha/beta fold hydrolase [Polyangiaceae bacterium]|jgi:3-oxoadipate enol-lactonase
MYVPTRLGRLYYEEHGQARRAEDAAIVLWPSFLTDGGMWDEQVRPLSDLGRVLVLDPPGHGKSDVPPPFSLDDNARALADALDALGAKRAVLVGLSWGGMIAMRLAALAPDRVAGLALLDTSAAPETMRNRVQYRAMLSTFRRVGFPSWGAERRIIPLYFAEETIRTRPELPKRFWSDAVGFSREGVYKSGKAIFQRDDFRPKLNGIRTPTLVMCGAEDRATPPERAEEIARGISGAELVSVAGAGHLSAIEQPERVNAALIPFVRARTSAQ